MKGTQWAPLLAYVTGPVNQQLLFQNEYLAAENRIPRAHLPKRLRLTNPERSTLGEVGKRLGRKALEQLTGAAKPETILAWYRRLVAQKFDGAKHQEYPGRPRFAPAIISPLLFPEPQKSRGLKRVKCRQRLGGLLKYYARAA